MSKLAFPLTVISIIIIFSILFFIQINIFLIKFFLSHKILQIERVILLKMNNLAKEENGNINWEKLKNIKYVLFPLIVGGIVGFAISGFIDYDSLNKPAFSPPKLAFPIAWTILYILMGVSYGIINEKNLNDSQTKFLYYLQLGVNALWSVIFFILKWRLFAFIWIILLDILVIIMTINFYKKNKLAGLLQIPYIIWILFATYLNWGFYILN